MLPMIKLGGLVARTLTKPLARVVKSRSKVHPVLNAICGRLGQQQHRASMTLHMGFRGISNYTIKPLPADQAVEQGADLVGELLIFSVALGAASLEYSRSAASARVKEQQQREKQEQEERELEARFAYLEGQVGWLEDRLEQLTRLVEAELGPHAGQALASNSQTTQQPRTSVQESESVSGVQTAPVSSSLAKLWSDSYSAVAGLFK